MARLQVSCITTLGSHNDPHERIAAIGGRMRSALVGKKLKTMPSGISI